MVGFTILLGIILRQTNAADPTEKPTYQPPIAAASKEGEQSIQGFKIPEFLKPSLVAAEPDLANPVAFCIDAQGRFYIAETFRQKKGVEDNRSHMSWLHDDLAAQSVADRVAYFKKHLGDKVNEYAKEQDRIRLLEDVDGDGVVDRATVFADGFGAIEDGTGAGLLAHDGDLFYTCIPKLYRLRDNDGDGRADVREALQDGYGVRVAFRGHDMHGLTLGPDGRIYFSIGDRGYNVLTAEGIRLKKTDTGAVFRCELDGSHLEVFAYGLRNPQELAFDNFGNLFTGDNNSDSGDQARWVYVVEGGDTGWRMYYQYLPDRGPWNRERMWYPHHADPETQQKQPAYIVPPIANLGDGPSGLTFYPGVGLPERYADHFFMADFRGSSPNSGIRSFSTKPEGASFKLTDSHEFLWSVLATDVDFGYDGSLYLTDWVNGWDGPGKGRLYRFSAEIDQSIRNEVSEMFATGFEQFENEILLKLLSHRDRRVRQQAQFTLVDRKPSLDVLKNALSENQPQLARVHGIWAVGQLLRSEVTPERFRLLNMLINDADEEIRAQVARVLGDVNDASALDVLREMIAYDKSPRVKHLAAISLGRIYHNGDHAGDTAGVDADMLLEMLRDAKNKDAVLRHSVVMGLVGIGQIEPQYLMASKADGAGDSDRLALLLALRRLQSAYVAEFLGDPNPDLILEAARAIHDEPMEELNDKLATLIARKELRTIDPLMRRVLHAAYRNGSLEYVSETASIAADDAVSLPVRKFAAELLKDWNQPGPLDRVIGAWRPLEREPVEGIGEQIKSHLAGIFSADDKLRTLGIELAAKYGVKNVKPLLWSIYRDTKEPATNRISALEALAALKAEKIQDGVEVALNSDLPELRASGRNLLLQSDLDAALVEMERAIEQGEPLEQQAAIQAIAGLNSPRANQILERLGKNLLAGKLPAEIQLDVLEAVQQRNGGQFKQLTKIYNQQIADSSDPLKKYQVSLKGGDRQRGYDIFFGRSDASCRRCHQVNHSGGEVGPDLSMIGKEKDRKYILESIVNPNAKIAKDFETAVLVMKNGKVITGIVQDQSTVIISHIKIMLNDGTVMVVQVDDIEERVAGRSGMPDDLVRQLSLSDIRDLVEYLSSLKVKSVPEGHRE
jgi:quinoprotein glucose dehydrogenase